MNTRKRCPLCNTIFEDRFCPHCGLAWSKFDSAYSAISEFQFCFECNTANPQDAKYCRNCGTELTSHSKDKNKHEWVDLGLSVLWAAENMQGYYPWMDDSTILNLHSKPLDLNFCNNGNDVATSKWGSKWRTPTKEEFEELIEKCQWEKCVIPNTLKEAFKVTGSNGNYIYLPVTGRAGMFHLNPAISGVHYKLGGNHDSWNELIKDNAKKSENDIFGQWQYWTSTESKLAHSRNLSACGFMYYSSYEKCTESPIDKEKMKVRLQFPSPNAAGFAIRPVMDKE